MIRINKSLFRLKLHYLLHGMGASPVVPFGSLIGRQLGVTPEGIGFIFFLIPLVGIVVKPVLGGIADKYGKKRLVLMLVILSAIINYSSLQYLPSLPMPPLTPTICNSKESFLVLTRDPCLPAKLAKMYNDTAVYCKIRCLFGDYKTEMKALGSIKFMQRHDDEDGESYTKFSFVSPGKVVDAGNLVMIPLDLGVCDKSTSFHCKVTCDDDPDLASLLNRANEGAATGHVFRKWEFWLFVLILTMAGISFGCGCTFQESICHEVLGKDGQKRYGEQRLWASVGWGGMAAVAGYLIDADSKSSLLYNYTSAFRLMFVFWLADLYVVSRLRVPERAGTSQNPWVDVGRLLVLPRTLAFLFWCTAVGFGFGAMGLHFWLLEDLGGNKSCDDVRNIKFLQGLCLFVNCIGETPVFFLSGGIIEKLGSLRAMSSVLVAHALRMLYYSAIVTPWQVLPIELIQGVTFGLFYPCLVSVSHKVAPPGAETTMTTLAFVVFDGLGCSLGGSLSGFLYKTIGGSATYWWFGVLMLVAAVLNWILLVLTRFSEAEDDPSHKEKAAIC